MKTTFKTDVNGLYLELAPETDQEKTLMQELISRPNHSKYKIKNRITFSDKNPLAIRISALQYLGSSSVEATGLTSMYSATGYVVHNSKQVAGECTIRIFRTTSGFYFAAHYNKGHFTSGRFYALEDFHNDVGDVDFKRDPVTGEVYWQQVGDSERGRVINLGIINTVQEFKQKILKIK